MCILLCLYIVVGVKSCPSNVVCELFSPDSVVVVKVSLTEAAGVI